VALPAKLQNDIRQFQRLQQELGAVQQQRLQIDLKVREVSHTLEELKTLPEDVVVYRPIGGLLVRAKDRKEVEDLLTEDKETAEVRLKAVERQENHLKERYNTMQQDLSKALQVAGAAAPSSSEPTETDSGESTDSEG
jgi:prefoldin beta subunit